MNWIVLEKFIHSWLKLENLLLSWDFYREGSVSDIPVYRIAWVAWNFRRETGLKCRYRLTDIQGRLEGILYQNIGQTWY